MKRWPSLSALSSAVSPFARASAFPFYRARQFAAVLAFSILPASLVAQQSYYSGPQQPYSYDYGGQYDPGQQYAQYPPVQSDYDQPESDHGQPQPLGGDQLEQLVAPIALHPDPLVALVLAASTYPAQVADADQWRQEQGDAPPDQIAYGANLQAWDPSVKALTAFPQVLAEMDRNIQWTGALGTAYYNQPQDVLQAVQIMRQRAENAGNLQSTPQEAVEEEDGNIQLMPVNPEVVYVPAYNPWTAYGEPVSPYPGFSLVGAIGSFFDSSLGPAVQFGVGTVLSAFASAPWGLLSWGLDWLTQNLLFNNSDYYSNNVGVADWGFRYGGPRAWMAPHREYAAYHRGWDRGYGREYGRDYGRGYGRGGDYGRGYERDYGRSFNRGSFRNEGRAFGSSQSLVRRSYGYSFRNQQDFRGNQHFNGRENYGSRFGYGSNYRNRLYGRGESPYSGRGRYGYGGSFRAYNGGPVDRGGQQFNRGGSAFRGSTRGFNGFSNRSYAGAMNGRSSHSGGFHLFGGHRNSGGFGRSGGGGHHFGGGGGHHFGGGGGHHFGGGGHHFGGGGHHFGGGGHHFGGGGGHHFGGGGGHHFGGGGHGHRR